MYYEKMKLEQIRLTQEIKKIKLQLQNYPSGSLICKRYGNTDKWYLYHNRKLSYIRKKDHSLAEELASKKYLSLLLNDLQREKKAVDAYLNYHTKTDGKAHELLMKKPSYQTLLSSLFQPISEELVEWQHADYVTNSRYKKNESMKSVSGNIVRSKSELMIDTALYQHSIPFRYECELVIDGVTLFPDFTIRHPKTGRFYYWEHFGLMDHPVYADKAFSKLKLYHTNNILPTHNLITTFETQSLPLTPEIIHNTIQQYFL